MKPIQISPAAANDLLAIAKFLEEESGNPFLGDQFLSAAASTLETIETYPLIGRERPTRQQRLSSLRSFAINRPFGKYLIFYQPLLSVTLVVRVLHGSQDLGPILAVDSERDA